MDKETVSDESRVANHQAAPRAVDRASSGAASFPLSAAQSGIWFAQRMCPEEPIVVATFVEVNGSVDETLLLEASGTAARECGISTLRIAEANGSAHQYIDDQARLELSVVDLRDAARPEEAAQEWMRAVQLRGIDILRDPLITVGIVRVDAHTSYWFFRVHHVAADTHSVNLMIRRAAHLYTSAVTGAQPSAYRGESPEALVAAELDYQASARFGSDRDYWSDKLAGVSQPVSLAGATAPASADTHRVDAPITQGLGTLLDGAASAYETAPAVVVAAAFSAYLARYTSTDDAMLSFPVSGRATMPARRSAGMTANIVPLRPGVWPRTSVGDSIRSLQSTMTDAVRHQKYRWDDIVRDLGCDHGGSFGPTMNIALADPTVMLGFATGRLRPLAAGLVKDFAVHVYTDTEGAVQIGFEGNPNLYTENEVGTHLMRFLAFLESFLRAEPYAPVRSLRGYCAHLRVVR